jgi:prepilin peptidase CpaA
MPPFVLFALLASGVAAIIDWRRSEIPNWLTLGTLGAALIAHVGIGAVRGGLTAAAEEGGWALGGALVCALVPFAFWLKGAFGGGDVKMLAALGAVLLPMQGIAVEFYALVAAALLAPARLAWDGTLIKTLGNTVALVFNPLLPKAKRRELAPEMLTSVRFGPAIFAGVAISVFVYR